MAAARLALAFALAACGAPPAVKKPARPPIQTRMYAPLAFAADAAAPDRAVILGTDARGGSSIVPLAGTPAAIGGVAAVVAASAIDKDVGTFARAPGDDASARSATTFLAAIIGVPLARDVAIVGAIARDGSVIANERARDDVTAAAVHGFRRIGVPRGADELTRLARERGAQTVDVADVADAYRLVTGEPLPAPMPAAAADMALDPVTRTALAVKLVGWRQQLAAHWGTVVQLSGRVPPPLAALRDRAVKLAAQAEQLHKRHLEAAAHQRMALAVAFASAASETEHILVAVHGGDVAGARKQLADHAGDTRAVLEAIAARPLTTIGEALTAVSAFELALDAWTLDDDAAARIAQADALLAELASRDPAELAGPTTADRVATAVAPALLAIEHASVLRALAREHSELDAGANVAHAPQPATLARLAEVLDAKAAFDPRLGELAAAWAERPVAFAACELAAAELAQLRAAHRLHDMPPAMLDALLATAEQRARGHASAARAATGAIPVPARVAYEIALAERDGGPRDKLDALVEFWRASALSDVAVALARDVPQPPAPAPVLAR